MTQLSPAGGSSFDTQLSAFLQAERDTESGGNYTAYNSAGGASGAYQYIQSTWSAEAAMAGDAQYASGPASAAPPAVQDQVAAYDATQKYNSYGNWKDVAEAWYYPAWAGNPAYQNQVPYPQAGNTLTIGQYGDEVVSKMNHILGGGSNAVLTSAPGSGGSSAPASSGGSSGNGFIHSLDQALNPSFGLDPFQDTSHAIDMAIVRGGLVLVGLLMIAAGLAIVVLGSINILSVSKKAAAISKAAIPA